MPTNVTITIQTLPLHLHCVCVLLVHAYIGSLEFAADASELGGFRRCFTRQTQRGAAGSSEVLRAFLALD